MAPRNMPESARPAIWSDGPPARIRETAEAGLVRHRDRYARTVSYPGAGPRHGSIVAHRGDDCDNGYRSPATVESY